MILPLKTLNLNFIYFIHYADTVLLLRISMLDVMIILSTLKKFNFFRFNLENLSTPTRTVAQILAQSTLQNGAVRLHGRGEPLFVYPLGGHPQ